MKERRIGISPVPAVPGFYLSEQQVHSLTILKKFGWGLICIRGRSISSSVTILKNRQDRSLGVLEKNGVLKLNRALKIRRIC